MKTLFNYTVKGTLNFAIPYDVDLKVDGYSLKQVIHKTYLIISQDKNIKKLNQKIVYKKVRGLTYIKE